MELASKTVLIVGIDSFTGNHLARYMQEHGFDVYGTSLLTHSEKIFRCDITDRNDVMHVFEKISPDYLIFLSGVSFSAHEHYDDFYKINTISIVNILDLLVELNLAPKKIILASSATVYGNTNQEVLDESLCPSPINHYGASKYSMECLAKNYFNKLNIIITRPFNYTGVGQSAHFLIPKIVKSFQEQQQEIELGNLDVSREFNDIDYVCEIYTKLCIVDAQSEIVNICSGRGVKLLSIIDMMQEIANYKIRIKINPSFIRKDEISHLTGSTEKLFNLIGKVQQKDLYETLITMYQAR